MKRILSLILVFKLSMLMSFGSFLQIQLSLRSSRSIDLSLFDKPFCMVGNGDHKQSFATKLEKVKKYQRNISRKKSDFYTNKKKEKKATLTGSPKWVAIKYLRKRGYTWKQVNFAFYAMTLFAEAKNLDEDSMGMVAQVINNRKGDNSYINTVSDLAQFSSWYYKNQHDNLVLLCPDKVYHKYWKKSVTVAARFFNKSESYLKSTHYFAPRNMSPRYKIPAWAKGKHAVGYGGHIFLVKKGFKPREKMKSITYIPSGSKKIKVVRGEITL